MLELCKKCFESKVIGSFYCNQAESGKHLTGYVSAYSDEELLIKHVSPNGYYDGFILIHIADLIRVDVEGRYEKKISTLYTLRHQKHPYVNCSTDSFFISLIEFAHNNRLVVSVELEDSVLSGFIKSFDESYIGLQVVDEYGCTDGETHLMNDNVLSVAVDTSTEQNLKLLNDYLDN